MGISLVHWLVVLLPVVAGTIAVWLLLRRQPRSRDLMTPPRPSARVVTTAAAAVDLPAEIATRVWAELRFGRDINAIKLVRGATGLDLRDSKAVIDDMKRRDPELR